VARSLVRYCIPLLVEIVYFVAIAFTMGMILALHLTIVISAMHLLVISCFYTKTNYPQDPI